MEQEEEIIRFMQKTTFKNETYKIHLERQGRRIDDRIKNVWDYMRQMEREMVNSSFPDMKWNETHSIEEIEAMDEVESFKQIYRA